MDCKFEKDDTCFKTRYQLEKKMKLRVEKKKKKKRENEVMKERFSDKRANDECK